MEPNIYALDINITPNAKLPIFDWVQDMVGSVAGIGLLGCALGIILGGVAYAISKAGGYDNARKVSVMGIVVCLIVAVLIGSVGGLVNWASKQKAVASSDQTAIVRVIADAHVPDLTI